MTEKLDIDLTLSVATNHCIINKINELVDAVNNLQTSNAHIQKDLLEMRHPEAKENVDPYAEQRKWIGCLCWFWNDSYDDKDCSILTDIPAKGFSDTYASADGFIYKYCEPVKPDDDIIYRGE